MGKKESVSIAGRWRTEKVIDLQTGKEFARRVFKINKRAMEQYRAECSEAMRPTIEAMDRRNAISMAMARYTACPGRYVGPRSLLDEARKVDKELERYKL